MSYQSEIGGRLLICAPDAARLMGITVQRLYQLVREDELPQGIVVRFGKRQLRFNTARLRAFCNGEQEQGVHHEG